MRWREINYFATAISRPWLISRRAAFSSGDDVIKRARYADTRTAYGQIANSQFLAQKRSNFSQRSLRYGEEEELRNWDLVAAGARFMSALILSTFCRPEIDTRVEATDWIYANWFFAVVNLQASVLWIAGAPRVISEYVQAFIIIISLYLKY